MNVNGSNPMLDRLAALALRSATPPATANPSGAAPAPAAGTVADPDATAALEGASLWDVLTTEEREFFSQQATLGALTYRPGGAAPASAAGPTGQRIDVRG